MRTVLVIDEAHLLPAHLLEEIRLLSNFETNREKLLQVILCGQPELHDVLAQPELRQLKQRISLKCQIKIFTERETCEYIRWRLRVAGARDEHLFTDEALRMVHHYSGGIPRIINNICDNALLSGFSEGSPRITEEIIGDVIDILDLAPMTVASPQTVKSIVAEQERQATPGAAKLNPSPQSTPKVRYIRPAPEPEESKFTIKTEQEEEAPRFFARVKVLKR
jgi:general secretion pathway protein A